MGLPVRTTRRRLRTVVWVACVIGAFVATHVPPPDMPIPHAPSDKLLHFVGYAVLGIVTVWRVMGGRSDVGARTLILWCLGLIAWGFFDERTQPLVRRGFEWLDWVANIGGAVTGVLVMACYQKWTLRGKELEMKDARMKDEG